jgi:hypothetical protein
MVDKIKHSISSVKFTSNVLYVCRKQNTENYFNLHLHEDIPETSVLYVMHLSQQVIVHLKHTQYITRESRASPIAIVTGYGMHDRGVRIMVPVGQEFSLLHIVEAGFEAHQASYPTGNRNSYPRAKECGAYN